MKKVICFYITFLAYFNVFSQISNGLGGTIVPNNPTANTNVGIGNTSPKEKLQIGNMWTFHDGGSKVIGYNFYWNNEDKRITNTVPGSKFVMDGNGSIHFDQNIGVFPTSKFMRTFSVINRGIDSDIKDFGKVVIWSDPNMKLPGNYKLYVGGGILAEYCNLALMNSTEWADYVFEDNYKLMSLKDTEKFIKENKHLPNVPSATEMVDKGMDIKKTNVMLMAKVEELTLHLIELNKKIEVFTKSKQMKIMKNYLFLIAFFLILGVSFAQNKVQIESSKEKKTNYDSLSKQVWKEMMKIQAPPTGILTRLPYSNNDLKREFTGQKWLKNFKELKNGSMGQKNVFDMEKLSKDARTELEKGVIPIGIVVSNYDEINEKAIDQENLKNGKVVLNKQEKQLYNTKKIVMASPLLNNDKLYSRKFKFIIKPEFIFNSSNEPIKAISIDFDDGKGFQKISMGQPISIAYGASGTVKKIKTKIENGNNILTTIALIYFNEISSPFDDISQMKFPDRVIELTSKGGGKAYIEYGCNKKLWKPYIFVEGLDFNPNKPEIWLKNNTKTVGGSFFPTIISDTEFDAQKNTLEMYVSKGHLTKKQDCFFSLFDFLEGSSQEKICYEYNYRIGDFGWDIFRTGKDFGDDPLKIEKMPCLIEKLKADGFDIILLDLKDNPGRIEDNAEVLIELIEKINAELKINGSKHNLVINGASMGGLVSRYALRKMENTPNKYHNTKLWMTMDSPHDGANIPIGFQVFLSKFLDATNNALSNIEDVEEKRNEAQDGLTKLNKSAPKQMLIYHQLGNSEFTNLFQNFNMNFPQMPKKVGISNGSGIGVGQGFGAGNKIAEIDASKKTLLGRINVDIAEIFATSDNTITYLNFLGINLPIRQTKPVDSSPGGQRSTVQMLDKKVYPNLPNPYIDDDVDTYGGPHCFIPTFSGLAIPTQNVNLNIKNHLQGNGITIIPHSNYPYLSIPKNKQNTLCAFDNIYYPNQNQSHVELTDDNVKFAFNMVSPKILYLENETVVLNRVEEARDKIIIGERVVPRATGDNNDWSGKYKINANGGYAIFRAGKRIELKPGFKADKGSVVKAYIKPFECLETSNCW